MGGESLKEQNNPREFARVASDLEEFCGEHDFAKARLSIEWMSTCLKKPSSFGRRGVDQLYPALSLSTRAGERGGLRCSCDRSADGIRHKGEGYPLRPQ
jgi:hypothetical protein